MVKPFDRAELENSIVEDIEKAMIKKHNERERIGKITGAILGIIFMFAAIFNTDMINWGTVWEDVKNMLP